MGITMLVLQRSRRERRRGGVCQRLGCVIGQGIRMVEEKCALPHDRLMLEEDRWDEFCGDSAWLAEGRGGGVPGVAASMCPLLAALLPLERDVCCVLAWDARPLGGRSTPHAPLLFQKPVTWPVAVSV